MRLLVFMTAGSCERLKWVLEQAKTAQDREYVVGMDAIREYFARENALNGRRILFAIGLDEYGMNPEYYELLSLLRRSGECLSGGICGILVDGKSEWYTKSVGRELSLAISEAGGQQIGRPFVEGTGSLKNQMVTASNLSLTLEGAYVSNVENLLFRLLDFVPVKRKNPKLLCLHASERKTSNTLKLWDMIKQNLPEEMAIKEISLRNGEINDCAGCPFQMCMHFSKKDSCYYGGTIVDAVYPAVEECDGLILICPNYNDAISANISAFINRLTALFRKRQFYEKQLFAVVVSGYSGSDLVAAQLLDALSLNKTFILPPKFVLTETANQPGEIMLAENVEDKAKRFAAHIWEEMGDK